MIFTCVYIVFRIAYVGFFGRLFTILPSIKNWKVLEEISEFVDKNQLAQHIKGKERQFWKFNTLQTKAYNSKSIPRPYRQDKRVWSV